MYTVLTMNAQNDRTLKDTHRQSLVLKVFIFIKGAPACVLKIYPSLRTMEGYEQ